MPRKKMTLAQHRELGLKLKNLYDELTTVAGDVPNALGLTSKAGKLAAKPMKALSELRCELDKVVFKEFPHLSSDELAGIYYPGPQGIHESTGPDSED